jgi:hypothetical protein
MANKETVSRMDAVSGNFINVDCFDCHIEKKQSRLKHSTTSGERAVRNAQKVIDAHMEGHRINLVVGRKPKP